MEAFGQRLTTRLFPCSVRNDPIIPAVLQRPWDSEVWEALAQGLRLKMRPVGSVT